MMQKLRVRKSEVAVRGVAMNLLLEFGVIGEDGFRFPRILINFLWKFRNVQNLGNALEKTKQK